jgi:hypothetical protein
LLHPCTASCLLIPQAHTTLPPVDLLFLLCRKVADWNTKLAGLIKDDVANKLPPTLQLAAQASIKAVARTAKVAIITAVGPLLTLLAPVLQQGLQQASSVEVPDLSPEVSNLQSALNRLFDPIEAMGRGLTPDVSAQVHSMLGHNLSASSKSQGLMCLHNAPQAAGRRQAALAAAEQLSHEVPAQPQQQQEQQASCGDGSGAPIEVSPAEVEYALMMAAAFKQAEALRDAAVAAAARCAAYKVSHDAELLTAVWDATAQLKALVPLKPCSQWPSVAPIHSFGAVPTQACSSRQDRGGAGLLLLRSNSNPCAGARPYLAPAMPEPTPAAVPVNVTMAASQAAAAVTAPGLEPVGASS